MDVRALGYIEVGVSDLAAWTAYAEAIGAMVVPSPHNDRLLLRIDGRPYRVAVQRSDDKQGLAFAGWEFADQRGLDQAVAELEAAGHPVKPSSELECVRGDIGGRRCVRDSGRGRGR